MVNSHQNIFWCELFKMSNSKLSDFRINLCKQMSLCQVGLRQILKTGSTLALTGVTIVSPLAATTALANSLSFAESPVSRTLEIAQSPTPAPAPDATPTPTPAPETPAAPTAAPETAPAPRADTPGLFERVEYINTCRQTNRAVEIFADTALSPVNRVGSLGANAQVTLTGVLAPGRAQIVRRNSPDTPIVAVGWVNSAYLTACGSSGSAKACYRVNVPELTLRSGPSSTSSYQGTLSSGSIVYATDVPPKERTSPNTAPDFGRIWVEVFVRNNIVWLSRTGPSGVGENATQLSGTECQGQ